MSIEKLLTHYTTITVREQVVASAYGSGTQAMWENEMRRIIHDLELDVEWLKVSTSVYDPYVASGD